MLTYKLPGNDLLEMDTPLNAALVPTHKKSKRRNLYLIEGYLNKDQTLIFCILVSFSEFSLPFSFLSGTTKEVVKLTSLNLLSVIPFLNSTSPSPSFSVLLLNLNLESSTLELLSLGAIIGSPFITLIIS